MARPTQQQWRIVNTPIVATTTIPAQTVRERILAALASYVTRTNPDGTSF